MDDCGDYESAFGHYVKGNNDKAGRVLFDRAKHVVMLKSLRDTFQSSLFSRLSACGDPSRVPVFIVGMPRSGTSLVEQVLASHSSVYGADELTHMWRISQRLQTQLVSASPYPDCVRNLSAEVSMQLSAEYLCALRAFSSEALRVIDKMPYNYLHLGLIALLLPNARIIHCRRDARDICLSNFFQLYAHAHHYTYRLNDLVLYYREYEKLMDHWREHLPLDIHEVLYEELVDDLEGESRRLDWNTWNSIGRRVVCSFTTPNAQFRRPVIGRFANHSIAALRSVGNATSPIFKSFSRD